MKLGSLTCDACQVCANDDCIRVHRRRVNLFFPHFLLVMNLIGSELVLSSIPASSNALNTCQKPP